MHTKRFSRAKIIIMLLKNPRSYLIPDWYLVDLKTVDWRLLYQKGIRIVLLDMDNTLVAHGSDSGDDYSAYVIEKIKEAELLPILFSNARDNRGEKFASSTGIDFEGRAKKPKITIIEKVMAKYGYGKEQIVIVGDQIFTDLLAGKRAKTKVLLVKPRFRIELVTVMLKRLLEKIIVDKSRFDQLEDISLARSDQHSDN